MPFSCLLAELCTLNSQAKGDVMRTSLQTVAPSNQSVILVTGSLACGRLWHSQLNLPFIHFTMTKINMNCNEIRTTMLAACAAQMLLTLIMIILGAAILGLCDQNYFGDWAMVYGSVLFASTAVTSSALFGRQRQLALISLSFGLVVSSIVLIMDGIGYFCLDLRKGVNRNVGMCPDHIQDFNSCAWVTDWDPQKSKTIFALILSLYWIFH